MLIYLSTTGEILSRNFRILISRIFCIQTNKSKAHRNENTFLNSSFTQDSKLPLHDKKKKIFLDHDCDQGTSGRIAIGISLVLIILYITSSAYVFQFVESWTYIEGTLFCFTSLSTIGFGEMMPGIKMRHPKKPNQEIISVITVTFFIFIGMGLIAMTFNLVQEQILLILKKLTNIFSTGEENEKDDEGLSMSVLSSSAS